MVDAGPDGRGRCVPDRLVDKDTHPAAHRAVNAAIAQGEQRKQQGHPGKGQQRGEGRGGAGAGSFFKAEHDEPAAEATDATPPLAGAASEGSNAESSSSAPLWFVLAGAVVAVVFLFVARRRRFRGLTL
jgi:hypothetical protein